MTSPLPPRRRDTRSLVDRVRQDRINLKQLGVGFADGRFSPIRPLGSSALFGDLEDDDTGVEIGFWNTDRAVASGSGTVTLTLTHTPIDGSLHVYWNGISQLPTDWVLNENVVTIPDPSSLYESGDVLASAYAYEMGDDEVDSGYDAAVLARPTLLGFWRLAEDSGSVMVDSSGHGHHGVYTAGVVLGQTPILTDDPDLSADFPADESARGVVPFGSWMNVPTFTIESWIETDAVSGGVQAIVSRDTNARAWSMQIDSGGNFDFFKVPTGGGNAVGTATLDDTNRHYVVVTYDNVNARLYVDGALIQTTALTGDPSAAADLAVGATYAGDVTWWPPYYFKGRQSKVAFYSGAEPLSEIQNRWQIGTGTA